MNAQVDWYTAERRKRGAAATEKARSDIALDKPFYEDRAAKAIARQPLLLLSGREGRRQPPARPDALGLVSNETKGTPTVEKFLVDGPAKRIKRMRNGVQHAARLIDHEMTAPGHPPMVRKFLTLTYADVDGWEPQHINAFRRRLRAWAARKGYELSFVWVSELQERGALHYHMVIWVPAWAYIPTPDKNGWWPHGSTNLVTARSPIGYISKYASKTTAEHSRRYPKGARMHGAGGLQPEMRRHIRYWQSPFWVRDALTGRADIRKVTGGYADRFTGEFLPSPWAVLIVNGLVYCYRKEPQSC